MTRLSLLYPVLVLATSTAAFGQSPYWDMAPWRFGLQGMSADMEVQHVRLSVDRSVPLDFFLPNVSPGSRLDVLGLSAGVRADGGRLGFRWGVSPLELDLTKPPWTGGVTLLRYDRTGIRDLEADWLVIHAGPALRLQVGMVTLEPAIVLRGGLASRKTGRRVFGWLDHGTATGFAGSARARIDFSTTDRSMLRLSADAERLWGGANPQLRTLRATLLLRGSQVWTVGLEAGLQEARVNGESVDAAIFGFRLLYTLVSANGR